MKQGIRTKHTFRLPPALASQLADFATRKRASQAGIVEAALISFLSPDGSERMEAAFSRRMDRVLRQLEQLDRDVEIGNEALALFVRFWLTSNPPLPDAAMPAAQAQGKERYDAFVEALSRRIQVGPSLRRDTFATPTRTNE